MCNNYSAPNVNNNFKSRGQIQHSSNGWDPLCPHCKSYDAVAWTNSKPGPEQALLNVTGNLITQRGRGGEVSGSGARKSFSVVEVLYGNNGNKF